MMNPRNMYSESKFWTLFKFCNSFRAVNRVNSGLVLWHQECNRGVVGSALNSLLRAAKGFLMGQPHDGPTCCLIIARVRFRNPHSHLGTIFPGGPCPPIDMLCKAAQLAAMHATTFIVRRPLLRIRIRALQVRVCMTPLSMPTSRGWLYLTFRFPAARSLHHRVEETTPVGGGQGPGHRLGNDDLV